MEHQKIMSLLDNIQNESSKFRTRNLVEINDESKGTYKVSDQIKFKISSAPFTEFISSINNTQIDNSKDIDAVVPMSNLIDQIDNYSKTSGSLWQYYRDKPSDQKVNSKSFESKIKITGNTPDNDNKKKC